MMSYTPVPPESQKPLIRRWLMLAVTALGLSGLFSLPPAIFRGHFFQQHMDTQHIFDVALIIHVNLSVLVWILTITCLLWSFFLPRSLDKIASALWYFSALGTALIAISPFMGGLAVKSNYIPMLLNAPFIIGLSMLLCAVTAHSVIFLCQSPRINPLMVGLYATAITTGIAVLCFMLAGYQLQHEPRQEPEIFYNLLFWGGGHVLQFVYTNVMLVAWLWLASIMGIKLKISPAKTVGLFALNVLCILPTPLFFLLTPDPSASMPWFTTHMQIFAGIVPTLLGIIILWSWYNRPITPLAIPGYIRTTLLFSLLFFAYGGLLGLIIRQMNTIVPAHYHASVVGGLTLALMGMCYHILPLLGYHAPTGRLVRLQPYLYATGHLLHITGLAVMGGYGALRKTAADTGHIDTLIGKLMFFTGSPLALLGGLLFIVIMARCMMTSERTA